MESLSLRGVRREVLRCHYMDPRRHSSGSQTAVVIYHLFQEVLRHGVTADELFALTGLRPHDVADFDRRLDADTLFAVWETLMRRLRDPGLPVRAARAAQASPRSAVSLLVEASATVREAFDQVTRYGSAWSTIYTLRVQPWRDGGIVVAVDGLGTDRLGERCEAEYTVAEVVLMLRAYAAAAPATPVRFAHPAPARITEHRRLFGPTVCFGASRTELVVTAATLALPLRTARPGLAAILAARLDEVTLAGRAPAFSLRVRQEVLEHLGQRRVSAASVARGLAVSERTLHRRLAAEGTTLRGLLDQTRHVRAVEMLDGDRYPVKEVATALGFASARSLHRAYRRWTGTTPRGTRA
jgi:AraC-like DNA-binding protein